MLPVSIITRRPTPRRARLDADYGPCDSDRRHIFALSGTVQSPEFDSTALRDARIRLAALGQLPRLVRQAG